MHRGRGGSGLRVVGAAPVPLPDGVGWMDSPLQRSRGPEPFSAADARTREAVLPATQEQDFFPMMDVVEQLVHGFRHQAPHLTEAGADMGVHVEG